MKTGQLLYVSDSEKAPEHILHVDQALIIGMMLYQQSTKYPSYDKNYFK